MELKFMPTPHDSTRGDIQDRAAKSKSGLTNQFAVWEDGQEVAFLSLDIYPPKEFPEVDWYTIYEIFVPEPLRNKGIATRVLAAAEQVGRDRGLRYARLYAKPLDKGRTQEQLIEWYTRHGYTIMPDSTSTDMHKDLLTS
ncbi:MAG TPA: GNAT family N-acetyltransferase [Candidatus Angelobacter sp.]|jgi:GNAT superfamily N-acetyltransferase